jgi:anti-sigma factor RsiW
VSPTDYTPACRAAEAALKRIVAGEADARERDEFSAHLGACPRCTRALGETLALASSVRAALADAAARFPEAPPLALPARDARTTRSPLRVLTDFALLLTLGLGLFVLIALAFVSYRSITHTHRAILAFRAVQDVAVLAHLCERAREREPALALDALAARVRLDAARLLGADAFVDPWGTPYILAAENGRLAARSAGPNRRDDGGGDDDITCRSTSPALDTPPRTRAGRSL